MGIQGTTARIPARCDIGATPDSRISEPPERERPEVFRIGTRPSSRCYGGEAGSLPSSDMHIGLWRKAPISSTKPRTLHRGFGFIVIRERRSERQVSSRV